MLTDLEKYTIAKDILSFAQDHFTYIPDSKRWDGSSDMWMGEHWETPDELIYDIFDDGYVQGDCDAFAMLCWIKLREANIPSRLVYCTTETGEAHLICVTEEGWCLDNRQATLTSDTDLRNHGYTFISKSGLGPGEQWRATK